MKYDWNFCNYSEYDVPAKNNRENKNNKNNKKQQIRHIKQLWNLLDPVVSFEGATRFTAGKVARSACPRYSCCCVFCNGCVFAFVFRFCEPSAALIRSWSSFVVVAFY